MKVLASVAAVLLLFPAGCGGASEGEESNTVRVPVASMPKTTTVSPTAGALRGLEEFKACVRKAGAEVKSEPPTLDGRIAVGAAGNLPATHVGVVAWPNDAYMDVWFADNAEQAAATADKLNEAEAKAQGVTEVEAAFNNGRAIGAPGNTEAFGNLPEGGAAKIDACLAATNR
jgi:hypothetical protein